MPLPTPDEVRAFLEDFGITNTVSTDAWIEDQRDNEIVPYVSHLLGYDLDSEQTITEYHSGTGKDNLFLNKRDITALASIEIVNTADYDGSISLSSVELIAEKGIIKAIGLLSGDKTNIFPKGRNNIKVTYTIGEAYKTDIMQAVKMLMAIAILDNIADRTGGGNLNVQGFGRNYGTMGRYTVIIKKLNRRVHAILSKYTSSVAGS